MSNNSYFGGIAAGLKTLAIGMKTTMKEYFTPKSTCLLYTSPSPRDA